MSPQEMSLLRTTEAQTEPMNDLQMRMMIGLLMTNENSGKTLDEIELELKSVGELPMALEILLGRLRSHANVLNPNLKYNIPVLLFTGSLCETPGESVMWAYSIAYETFNKGDAFTMEDLIQCLPIGVPTKARINEIWDAQKHFQGCNDNWFDTAQAFDFKGHL